METGKPPPSRPVVSAGSGQNDHLSEIISHILEPLVKMRPNGMEVTSTGNFVKEGEDILDGLELMLTENGSGVTEKILMDATEIITAIIVARGLDT